MAILLMAFSVNAQQDFTYETVGDSAYNFTTIDSSFNNVRVRTEFNLDTLNFLDGLRARGNSFLVTKSEYQNSIGKIDESYSQLSDIHLAETGETLDDYFSGNLIGSLNGDWEFNTKATGKLDVTITDANITDGVTNGVVTYVSAVEISINWDGVDYVMYKETNNRWEGVDAQNKKTSLSN